MGISLHYVHNSLKGITFIYHPLIVSRGNCVGLVKKINFVLSLMFVLFMTLDLEILQKMPSSKKMDFGLAEKVTNIYIL